ncbi:MAG: bifunctional phosphoglucose/phosphomannose isomerase [Bacteroidota bacterium]
MLDLDAVDVLRHHDSLDCLGITAAYDGQFLHVLEAASALPLPPRHAPVGKVVTIGTGGWSAQGVEIVQDILFHELKVPLLNYPGYNLPAHVDCDSLVIVLSKYGNVEEVLSTTAQANARGASVLAVLAGGPLLDVCKAHRIPCLMMPLDRQPPRALIGYSVVPLLVFMHRLGLIRDFTPEIKALAVHFRRLAERYRVEVPVAQNRAKQLALAIQGKIPLIYGSLDHYRAAASRWKRQFGENSKMMAFCNVIPSLHHDEAVGWEMERELLDRFCLIMLRDQQYDSEKIKKRKDVSLQLLGERLSRVIEVFAEGDSLVTRVFSLIHLADFVSIYLALARGIDPGLVEVIDLFKRKMAE